MSMKHVMLGILLAAIVNTYSVLARPPASKLKPFKKKLAQTTMVDLDEDTLARALYFFRKEADVPVVIDFEGLREKLDAQVTITGEDISYQHILNWICRTTSIDYDIRDGVFYITTREKAVAPYLRTQFFDVRGLTIQPHDMPGPNIELSTHEHETSSRTVSGSYGSEECMDTHVIRNYLASMVSTDIWSLRNTGIEVRGGLLVVTAPYFLMPDIKYALNKLREKRARMVSVDARILAVDTGTIDTFLKSKQKKTLVFSKKETRELLSFFKDQPKIKNIGNTRTVCFNNQRIHVMSVSQCAYIRDVTPVIADEQASVDPEIDSWTKGNVLDVRPTLSFDNKWIYLMVRSTLAQGDDPKTSQVPVGAQQNKEIEPVIDTTFKDDTFKKAEFEGYKVRSLDSGRSAPVELPEIDVVTFKTSLRIPNGGSILLSGQAIEQEKIGMGHAEIMLFLKANYTK